MLFNAFCLSAITFFKPSSEARAKSYLPSDNWERMIFKYPSKSSGKTGALVELSVMDGAGAGVSANFFA